MKQHFILQFITVKIITWLHSITRYTVCSRTQENGNTLTVPLTSHESVAHLRIWIWFKRFTRTIIVFWGRKHLHNRKTICSCALQNPDNGWGWAGALCLCVAIVRRSAGAGWVFSFHPGRGSVGAAGCTWNRWFSYSSHRAPQHTGSGW